MELWKFLIICTISYSGIILGNLLIFFAPEELKPGRKYFRQFLWILLSLTVGLTLYLMKNKIIVPTILGVLTLLIYNLYSKKVEWLHKLIMPICGLLVGFSHSIGNVFLFTSGMIFLVAFPLGSLSIEKFKKKEKMKILINSLKQHLMFFVLAIISYFIF